MQNFKPLASIVWEENEVTDRRTDGRATILAAIDNGISNYSPAMLVRDNFSDV